MTRHRWLNPVSNECIMIPKLKLDDTLQDTKGQVGFKNRPLAAEWNHCSSSKSLQADCC